MFAECFPARLRYSGASLGYHLASVVAGGPAPLIAVALLAHYGSGYAVAGYIFVSAIASLAVTELLAYYTNKDVSAHCDRSKRLLFVLWPDSSPRRTKSAWTRLIGQNQSHCKKYGT